MQTKVKTVTGAKSGEYSRFLSFQGRNPDVLNSIANLSNDEVFTPPEFANKMLDTLEKAWAEYNNGENLWSNPDLKFLDPFTKSGVFLREIASRLISGLESEIPDLQDRVDHILTKQVFGIATTHLTSLMARRSLYCSKTANGKHSVTKKFKDESGNIWFKPLPHTWGKGTVRELTMDESGNEVERFVDGKCKYCGASKRDFDREEGLELHAYGLIHTDDPKKWIGEIFGAEMQFDVIIGNPPYQISDGGQQGSASPIYQKFIAQAQALEPRFLSMVIPARWFAGGKGLDSFREEMLSDQRIRFICDYPDSRDAFAGVDVAGGVCFFRWERDTPGETEVMTIRGKETQTEIRSLNEFDTFIRDGRSAEIVRKVMTTEFEPLSKLIHSQKPFGLRSYFVPAKTGSIRLLASPSDGFVEADQIEKNLSLVYEWKVMVSKTASEHAGQSSNDGSKKVLSRISQLPPGSACTETYLVIGPLKNEAQAKNLEAYMKTKFFRFLLSLRLITQNISRDSFNFVPLPDLNRTWSDEDLYSAFGLSTEEVKLVETAIRSWNA